MRGRWFRALGFVFRKPFELVIRDGVQDATVYVDGFGKRIAVGGLGLIQFLSEPVELSVGAKNAIEVPPAGDRELLTNGFYDLGGLHGRFPPETICSTTPASVCLVVNWRMLSISEILLMSPWLRSS